MRDMTALISKIGNFIFSRTKMIFYEYHYNNTEPPQGTCEGTTFKALPPRDVPERL